MSDNDNASVDDTLEDERPDKLNYSVGQDALPEDNDPPAAPLDDTTQDLPDTHPSKDSELDTDEEYQEG